MALNFCNNNSLSAITALPASISGGGLNLISSQTASGSTSIEFTSGINSTYKSYLFKFYSIHPATDDEDLRVLFSSNAGSSYGLTKTTTYDIKRFEILDFNYWIFINFFNCVCRWSLFAITRCTE